MAKFGKRLLTFLLLLLLLLMTAVAVSRTFMRHGSFYNLGPGTTALVVGHSHTECALNDLLIGHVRNLSMGGESYFYTYLKLRKLFSENAQIKTVYICFSNNQVDISADEKLWDSKNMYNLLPRYSYLMDADEYRFLFRRNAVTVLESQARAFQQFLGFMVNRHRSCLEDHYWGGYLFLKREKVDSLLKTDYLERKRLDSIRPAPESIRYLREMVSLCRKSGVRVVLMRMPVHPLWPMLSNEPEFQEIRQRYFGGLPFADFKDFPLMVSQRGDFEHLNYAGARKFSVFFDRLVREGVLEKDDPQPFIKQAMDALAGTATNIEIAGLGEAYPKVTK